MKIPFLSLKDVKDKYSTEIHEAVARVLDSGWYLQGNENERFEKNYFGRRKNSKFFNACRFIRIKIFWEDKNKI